MESRSDADVVIAVDLDGTLTPADTLHEAAIQLCRDRPWKVLALPLWLLEGKAALKSRLASQVTLDAALLPYDERLIDWLRSQRSAGRRLVLCTASDQKVAQAVAAHLGLFDEVIASDGATNVAGSRKREALEARFGPGGFDYAGNAASDLDVWAGARRAIVVNAEASVARRAAQVATVESVYPPRSASPSRWARMLRLHQWLKNLLLFVPALAAHQIADLQTVWTLALAFLAFSLSASAVYIANDLLDLSSDRMHPRKRHRPFAAATVPIPQGLAVLAACLLGSLALASAAGVAFTGWLLLYLVLTSAYTLVLKRYVLVDALTLAALYTLRVIAGAAAVAVPLSFWLLAFSVFIFLSLAFVKRYAELKMQADAGGTHAHGRGYAVSDAPLVQMVGIAAGYAAVLVLALYLQGTTAASLYARPEWIWLAVPLMLYWVSWVWLKAHRGEMHDDPIVFAVRDRASRVVAVLIAATFTLATAGWGV